MTIKVYWPASCILEYPDRFERDGFPGYLNIGTYNPNLCVSMDIDMETYYIAAIRTGLAGMVIAYFWKRKATPPDKKAIENWKTTPLIEETVADGRRIDLNL